MTLWRQKRPSSLVELTVDVVQDYPLPELRMTMRSTAHRWQGDVHLTWAEAHTLAESLTDWLWRTQPRGPEHPPPATRPLGPAE